jgi:AcrR family transcriptional regulator
LNTVKIKKPAPRAKKRAYHHGDLRRKLIEAAEAIILERGVDGFTLREAARRAGVSPAAPAHHFKDSKGLLTEVARLGFQEFGDALEAADKRGGKNRAKRLNEQGTAYVTFALANPARFQLMFRPDKHDYNNAEFVQVANRSFQVLEAAVRAAIGTKPGADLSPDGYGFLMATWSIVHGFSHLALGGELSVRARGGPEAIVKSLLPRMLKFLPTPQNLV